MNRISYVIAAVLLVLLVVIAVRISSLSGSVESNDRNLEKTIAAMQDSLGRLQRQIDTLRGQVPGLGEYMSTIQLHVSKLWFAAQASNWELCSFELGELNEAIDLSEELHIVRNTVDISSVLQSVQNTQLQSLRQSIESKQQESFQNAYNQTLDACNGCHRSAGYGYIHVITPTGQPVTNQRWTPAAKD